MRRDTEAGDSPLRRPAAEKLRSRTAITNNSMACSLLILIFSISAKDMLKIERLYDNAQRSSLSSTGRPPSTITLRNAPMEFGVFILAQQRGYHQSSQQVIRNAVEQTVTAEAAGFDTAWYAEHHFNNYSLCPSPLMMVAHCAGVTKRIRLGTAVCVLPLYH